MLLYSGRSIGASAPFDAHQSGLAHDPAGRPRHADLHARHERAAGSRAPRGVISARPGTSAARCARWRLWSTVASFLYVFDRVTGQPVWPIEERPVPQGDVPGEWYSPTQPFPTRPPAYARQAITPDELIRRSKDPTSRRRVSHAASGC